MKYVALLRGINVGGNNKIAMADLKVTFESLGFQNVSTYINSGNVIFETKATDTDALARKIERAIEKDFSLDIPVVVRSKADIVKLAQEVPKQWTNDKEQKTDVFFLFKGFDTKKSLDLLSTRPKVDTMQYASKAIIWNLKRSQYGKSGMSDLIGTELYKNMTARNINTVRKLAELME